MIESNFNIILWMKYINPGIFFVVDKYKLNQKKKNE